MLILLLVQLQQMIGLKLHQNKNSSALSDEDSDGMIFLFSLLGFRVEYGTYIDGFQGNSVITFELPRQAIANLLLADIYISTTGTLVS